MQITCRCETAFQSTPAPCPDGLVGCCVAHYDKGSFLCPACGHDNGPEIAECIRNGKVFTMPGIVICNTAAVAKLVLSDALEPKKPGGE